MQTNSGISAILRLLIISGFLLLIGLLFARFVGSASAPNSPYAPEKVNLALRRTVHHLLRAAGDSTSRIPGVQQANPQTFRIQLGHPFNYDQLPGLLQESFRLHKVTESYDVAVLDCARNELQLGYNVSDLIGNKLVPCGGRSLPAGCYVLQVTFAAAAPPAQPRPFWPVFAVGGLLAGLALVVWRWKERASVPTTPPLSSAPATLLLHFGRSYLDVANQTLTTDTHQHNLTYREAKLLTLLVSHPNQVLERNQILKLIWEDEGITVGRSVDVFVSRLRKLLHHDPTVKIAAVHGIGYRLDVQERVVTCQ